MKEKKTILDICEQFKVSRQTVDNWRRKNMLVGTVENGQLVFSIAEVESLPGKRIPRGRRRKEVHG